MFQSNSLIGQVAMVESKCQRMFKKKEYHLPAEIFNRSPNPTPKAKLTTPSRKSMISPIKSRRQQSVVANENLNLSNSLLLSSVSPNQIGCQNHPNKVATFGVENDEEDRLYCQKCAISLASNGFKVVKISHPRQTQITQFLSDLTHLMSNLSKTKHSYQKHCKSIQNSHQQQLQAVNLFYNYLHDALETQKNLVIDTLVQNRDEALDNVKREVDVVDQCLVSCSTMKQDVRDSMQIIKIAQERSFRPVMESYKERLSILKATYQDRRQNQKPSAPKQIYFNHSKEEVSERMLGLVEISLEEQQECQQQSMQASRKQSGVHFSFDNQGLSSHGQNEDNMLQQFPADEDIQPLISSTVSQQQNLESMEQYDQL